MSTPFASILIHKSYIRNACEVCILESLTYYLWVSKRETGFYMLWTQHRKLLPVSLPAIAYLKNSEWCIGTWSHRSWICVLLLFCWATFLIYKMMEMVPGSTVIVTHSAWHLEVGNTCADLLLSDREDQNYSVVFQCSFSILKLYVRNLAGEEWKSPFYSEERSHNI